MTSFLRRKSKQEEKPPLAISSSVAPTPTPLFAKFATATNTNGPPPSPGRMVSAPMGLSGGARRENSVNGGRHAAPSSVSIASGKERIQKTHGGPPSSFQYGATVADKPLPSSPPGAEPRRVVSTRSNTNPTIVPLKQQMRSRTSLNIPSDKPLPSPGRKLSVTTAFLPPNPLNTHVGRRSPVITNLMDDEFDLTPEELTPRTSQKSAFVAQQGPTNGASKRVSYAIDLPPEFALFQEFNPTSPDHDHPSPPAAPAKLPRQQQITSLGARSAVPEGAPAIAPRSTNSSPLKSKIHSPIPQPSDMGNNISALNPSTNGLYPSVISSFQGSRPIIGSSHLPAVPQFNSVQTKQSFKQSGGSNSPPPPPGASPAFVTGPPPMDNVHNFNVSVSVPRSAYQPPGAQPAVAPVVRGKARIFATMNAVGNETLPQPIEQSSMNLSQPPSPQQYSQRQLPNQPLLSPGGHMQRRSPFISQLSLSPAVSTDHDVPPVPVVPTPDHYNNGPPIDVLRTPRATDNRRLSQTNPHTQPQPQPPLPLSLPQQQHQQQHQHNAVQNPPRTRKLSKVRQPSEGPMNLPNTSSTSIMSASVESLHSSAHGQGKVHQHNGHRTLAKAQPVSLRPGSSHGHKRSLSRSPTKQDQQHQWQQRQQAEEGQAPPHVDEETIRKAGIPLDDDPFAKVEGVRMLKAASPSSPSKEGSVKRSRSKEKGGNGEPKSTGSLVDDASSTVTREDQTVDSAPPVPLPASPPQTSEERRKERRERRAREKELRKAKEREAAAAAAFAQAEIDAAASGTNGVLKTEDGSLALASEKVQGEIDPVGEEGREAPDKLEDPKFFPFAQFLSDPQLTANLLSFMSFYDWCILSSVSREIRIMLVQSQPLREEVLECFLKTVGYSRWTWDGKDPLPLSLQDLADYMRGVSTPSHEYARVARMYVHSQFVQPPVRDPSLEHVVRCLTASARAYTRVVLRLRAQGEKEASVANTNPQRSMSTSVPPLPPSSSGAPKTVNGYVNGYGHPTRSTPSRPSSRAPSPTMSNYSHGHSYASSYGHGSSQSGIGYGGGNQMQQNLSQTNLTFRSPLFRLRRAPLLRVFVPSPEGDWLSDKSVLDCEAECKKAGVLPLMRMGDVVWDIAVGDEGNVGRLVYDGKYLIDLDYTFNPIGDLPKYIPTLAFPPSYFHRVIRTGAITSNPVAHIDIAPWGEEIAANLQLLQDRVKTETPQGAYHNVVRWVHRSSFVIRPPPRVMQRGPSANGRSQPHTPRIPLPDSENLFIDAGWYGTIVVETEGTNEALADLQERCGPRAFPPKPKPTNLALAKAREENRNVFRILREKSRPGEIWIKAVSIKERIL